MAGRPSEPRGPGQAAFGTAGGLGGGGFRGVANQEARTKAGEQKKAQENVRHLGAKTFYRKGNRWVDSEVKPEDEAKATVIEQFGDEFFRLARTQPSAMNQYLTFEEPVTVSLDGKVYRIEPAGKR